ncbi:MAG: helix-turn-helix domain-containing protein, partial [Pseudonocardiaceae bacterium]
QALEEDSAPDGAVGQRLKVQRKLAGLTQYQLADRAHVSKSLVEKVERGAAPASPAFTAATALALRIDVETLYGQPYGPPLTDPGAEHAEIPALRAVLDRADDPEPSGRLMTAAELRARLDDCDQDRARSRYAQMTAALPELLDHGYALATEALPGTESETAWALLTDAYVLAQTAAYRFGYLDLAALCNERVHHAAARSGDPLRVAVAAFEHGLLRLHRGDYQGVLRIAERAHAGIVDERSPVADAVRAQLHLREAIAHARSGSADRADEFVKVARELVAHGIPASPYYNIVATSANVEIHWVAVSVELSDGTTAVGRAEQVQLPEDAEAARLGHHWIDVARAWTLHGDRARALGALNQARRITPQQTRYHPQVHETLHILAEADRRATDSLAGFARWVGVHL